MMSTTTTSTEKRGVKRPLEDEPKRNIILNLNDGKTTIEITTGTDIGNKAVNEDRSRFGIARNPLDGKGVSMYLFGVFDGHGGVHAAEYVRGHLFERIAKDLKLKESKDMNSLLRNAFVGIHNDMKEREFEKWPVHPTTGELSTSGTTAAVMAIVKDKMWVAHVGDTRVIAAWWNGTKWSVERLTKIHNCSDPGEANSLIKRGGIICGNRVGRTYVLPTGDKKNRGFLSVTRALGNYWSFCPGTGLYAVSPEPDTCGRKLDKECLIVIASDGITDALTDLEIMRKFLKLDEARRRVTATRLSQGVKPEDLPQYFIADEIIEEAKASYETKKMRADNMTAITLRVTIST